MSVRLMTAVFAQPADAFANCAQRLIMVALADSANDEGLCWPLQATIASKCGISGIHAKRSLAVLRKAGWFRRERTQNGGKWGRNRYWLNVERLLTSDGYSAIPLMDTPRSLLDGAPAIHQEQPSVNLEPSIEPQRAPQAKRTRKAREAKPLTVVEKRKEQARGIISDWWAWYERTKGHKPMGNYHGATNAVTAALGAGHEPAAIKRALSTLGTSAVTVFALERALSGGARPNGQASRQAEQLEAIMNA